MLIILGLIFIVGLVIGSFLNVVILRTVSNESIVFPGSKCPKCQNPLKWYHNIPLISYILLGGKCAFCNEKISIQYPIVEFFTGLIFVVFGYLYLNTIFNTNESTPILLIMFLISVTASSLFIVISGTDFKEMQVSEVHLFLLIGLGLLYSIIIGGFAFWGDFKFGLSNWSLLFTPILYTLASIVIAFVFMEILRRICNFIMKTDTFGDGDSFIFSGVAGVITSLFGASDFKYVFSMLAVLFLLSVIISVCFSFPLYLVKLIKAKNWKLICEISLFIIYSVIYFYGESAGWFENLILLSICTMIFLILGVILCVELLKGIKNNNQNGFQIPFGPSLTLSGLVALLVMPFLLGIV